MPDTHELSAFCGPGGSRIRLTGDTEAADTQPGTTWFNQHM